MKIKTPLILLAILGCLVTSTFAQDGIHTRDIHLPCVEKNFNVYVHLSVDSTTRQPYLTSAYVDKLMEDVSKFFEPICMSFSACEINVIENYTFHNIVDSLRLVELDVLFAKPRRLNLFILGTIPDAFCGHSTFYGIHEDGGESIFIETNKKECADELSGQLAHHIGHYFGLSDTYHGNQLEVVDHPDCEMRADSICDTPADPFGLLGGDAGAYIEAPEDDIFMGEFIRACEFTHEPLDPNGQYYQPLVGNIMSAYPCRCGLTNEQFLKIVKNYNSATTKPY